jgi:cation diffusion facilitator CzcD-associated flavoprotein CzcO
MSNLFDTIVIGAGQAGLASAYYLQRARSHFLVLDGAGQIGESWLRRWDSLRLFTPVRYNSLPGLPFPGEPYALPVKDDVARYLEAYVAHFALPVRLNTRVSSLASDAHRFVVTTDGETFTARSVIVATGAYHLAYIPTFASTLSPSLMQIHSSEYRNPGALPLGSVLVVGAGNSGAQIALELAESGRPTWLSGRDIWFNHYGPTPPWRPRRAPSAHRRDADQRPSERLPRLFRTPCGAASRLAAVDSATACTSSQDRGDSVARRASSVVRTARGGCPSAAPRAARAGTRRATVPRPPPYARLTSSRG